MNSTRFPSMFRASGAALALAAALALGAAPALAQTYPTGNPTYTPQAVIGIATIAVGGGNYAFNVNGQGTVILEITGSPSGLAATVQGTTSKGASPTWTNLPVDQIGVARISAISTTGKYRVNSAGYAQIRLNVSALSSGATQVTMSGGLGIQFVTQLEQKRNSYSASALIGTGATNHFLVISGSATKTVRVTRAECNGGATAANDISITAEVDSAADTGDAGTAVTAVPHDSSAPAATAVVLSHTTSPTPTLLGLVGAQNALLAKLGTSTPAGGTPVSWDFGTRPAEQEIVLRGVAQLFALNASAAFGSGASVGCAIRWTEE